MRGSVIVVFCRVVAFVAFVVCVRAHHSTLSCFLVYEMILNPSCCKNVVVVRHHYLPPRGKYLINSCEVGSGRGTCKLILKSRGEAPVG